MLRLTVCFVALAAAAFAESRPRADAVADVYSPIPLDQQHLAGLFASRMRANTEGYLEHVDEKSLLAPFTSRASTETDQGAGENAGFFLQAASNAYEYTDDVQLKRVLNRVENKLASLQQSDGYLGIYTDAARWGRGDLAANTENMAGLIAYSRVTGSDDALAGARKIADLLSGPAAKAKPDLLTGQDAAMLIAPLLDLYRPTGDNRYLALATAIAKRKAASDASASQRMSRAIGLADLYRLVGDEAYLKRAEGLWSEVSSRLTLAGSPANEQSQNGDLGSACATLGWLRLNVELLRVTGRAVYAEQLERTLYNGLLAAQDPRTGQIDPSTPMSGAKHFDANAACGPAEAVGLSDIPAAVWGRYGYGVAVLTYSPGRASLHLRRRASVQLYSEGEYPESGSVLLHVEPSHDVHFPLRLFVPRWSKRLVADVGGTHVAGRPGEFLTIDREWKKGDTVRIAIDMPVTLIQNQSMPGQVALQRGPQVLAVASESNPDVKDWAAVEIGDEAANRLRSLGSNRGLPVDAAGQAYETTGAYEGKPERLLLVPFADAVNYRVWVRRSGT